MTFSLTRTHHFHILPVLARRLPEYHNKVIVKLMLCYDSIENTHVQNMKTERNSSQRYLDTTKDDSRTGKTGLPSGGYLIFYAWVAYLIE